MSDVIISNKKISFFIISSIFLSLIISLLLIFFPWFYTLGLLFISSAVILIWIKPEIGLFLLILTIPIDTYTTFFIGNLFAGFSATGVKLFGFAVILSWLARMVVLKERFRGIKTVGLFGTLFLAGTALSVIMSDNFVWSAGRFLTLTQMILLSFLCVNLIKTPKILKQALWTIIIAVTISSILALIQYRGPISNLSRTWGGVTRVMGGSTDVNYFASILVIALLISGGMFMQEKSPSLKTWLILTSIIMFPVFLFTFSRGGALSLVAALAYMIFKQKKKLRFFVVILILMVILIPFIPTLYLERLSLKNALEDPSVYSRLYLWKAAIFMWWDNPIFGVGAGNFVAHVIEYFPPNYSEQLVAHNTYLEILAELGILSFISFIALIIIAYRSIRAFPKTQKDKDFNLNYICSGLELAIISLLVGSMFISLEYVKMIWLVLGIGMALREIHINQDKSES